MSEPAPALPRSGSRDAAPWLATTIISAAMAYALYFASQQGLLSDDRQYWKLAERISQRGISEWPDRTRAFGYPLFVAICSGFRRMDPRTVRFSCFQVQLAVLWLSAFAGSRIIAEIARSEKVARIAYAAIVWNPVLLAHAAEALTDSLAASLLYPAALFCLPLRVERQTWRFPVGVLLGSLATALRPANAPVLGLLIFAASWSVARAERRRSRFARLGWIVLALLPLLPQGLIALQPRSPGAILLTDVYRLQRAWGVAMLKYGTIELPGLAPMLPYRNPWVRPGEFLRMRDFARERPARFALLLLLHGFALLDHDSVFTYMRSLEPWYRWPLALANYVFLLLAWRGVIVLARGSPAAVPLERPRRILVFFLLLFAAYVVVYLPTAVENRFALPLDMWSTPVAIPGASEMAARWRAGWEGRWRSVAVAVAVLAGCIGVSAWISAQRVVTPAVIEAPDVRAFRSD